MQGRKEKKKKKWRAMGFQIVRETSRNVQKRKKKRKKTRTSENIERKNE
jgi:hypothetical protein